MSAARHEPALGVGGFTLEEPHQAARRNPLPLLLLLVVGVLAAATIWFVAVPQLTKPAPQVRSCEVLVDALGNTRCVSKQKLEARRAAHGSKTSAAATDATD